MAFFFLLIALPIWSFGEESGFLPLEFLIRAPSSEANCTINKENELLFDEGGRQGDKHERRILGSDQIASLKRIVEDSELRSPSASDPSIRGKSPLNQKSYELELGEGGRHSTLSCLQSDCPSGVRELIRFLEELCTSNSDSEPPDRIHQLEQQEP